jgi:hypothetical protein
VTNNNYGNIGSKIEFIVYTVLLDICYLGSLLYCYRPLFLPLLCGYMVMGYAIICPYRGLWFKLLAFLAHGYAMHIGCNPVVWY